MTLRENAVIVFPTAFSWRVGRRSSPLPKMRAERRTGVRSEPGSRNTSRPRYRIRWLQPAAKPTFSSWLAGCHVGRRRPSGDHASHCAIIEKLAAPARHATFSYMLAKLRPIRRMIEIAVGRMLMKQWRSRCGILFLPSAEAW
jgi:hypothetical protein